MRKKSESRSEIVNILVVDDFLEWRVRIRSILQAVPGWKIVFEAPDGIEAVQKAAELRPKIVLLDIGPPRLNGIEAAKQIRKNSCDCKIIFLTANGDRGVKKTVLELGAEAYVAKDNAVRKRLPAIADALRNRV